VKKATEALALLENTPNANEPRKNVAAIVHAPYHGKPVIKSLAWIEAQKNNHYTIQLARSNDCQ
jgi:hypothetical protein